MPNCSSGFVSSRGPLAEAAFSALVRRHGPMVLRVSRNIVRDHQDAQDSFQVTFLILARKAGSLRVGKSLGPWLHGVACHVARNARATATRRRAHECRAAEMRPTVVTEDSGDDVATIINDEDGVDRRIDIACPLSFATCRDEPTTRRRNCWAVQSARSRAGWLGAATICEAV